MTLANRQSPKYVVSVTVVKEKRKDIEAGRTPTYTPYTQNCKMSSKPVLAVLFLALTIILANNFAHGQYATFYGERHCSGEASYGARLTFGCQNLPASLVWEWRQLSFDTNGACVTVYNQEDCEGRELANFNDARCRNIHAIGQVKSFRQCSGRTNSAFISG